MKRTLFAASALAGLLLLAMTGCSTGGSVKHQLAAMDAQIDEVQKQIDELMESDARRDYEMRQQANTVQAALSRAMQAGKLASGRLLAEASISDESVHFAFDKSDLSDEAKASVDIFLGMLKDQNKNVYIEIQGHTDDTGTEYHNLRLGQARADAVMRYLHVTHGIPLHRMNTFSYGESKPIAQNANGNSRAKNRRVALVVME
jgi:outer membrane protein OmpA-like peptidoglycan-associated protein